MDFLAHGQKRINFECEMQKPLDSAIVHITLFTKVRSQYQIFLIDVWEDGCKVLQSIKSERKTPKEKPSTVSEMILMYLKKYTNFDTCPISGTVYFRNLTFPYYKTVYFNLPTGQYRLDSSIFTKKNITIQKFSFYFTINHVSQRSIPE